MNSNKIITEIFSSWRYSVAIRQRSLGKLILENSEDFLRSNVFISTFDRWGEFLHVKSYYR